MAHKKALFLDRDGVVNKVLIVDDKPFSPRKFEDIELLPEVERALICSKDMGFKNIIITNQPDIARGLMVTEELKKIHTFIRENLPIDDIMICPHSDSDRCVCRKPKPGMLVEASKKWNIDLKSSFMVGDNWKDMSAGKKAGCLTILIDMPYNQRVGSDLRVKDLREAVEIIAER